MRTNSNTEGPPAWLNKVGGATLTKGEVSNPEGQEAMARDPEGEKCVARAPGVENGQSSRTEGRRGLSSGRGRDISLGVKEVEIVIPAELLQEIFHAGTFAWQ